MIHGKRECEVGSCVHYELDDSSVPHGLDMANYSVSSRVRLAQACAGSGIVERLSFGGFGCTELGFSGETGAQPLGEPRLPGTAEFWGQARATMGRKAL